MNDWLVALVWFGPGGVALTLFLLGWCVRLNRHITNQKHEINELKGMVDGLVTSASAETKAQILETVTRRLLR